MVCHGTGDSNLQCIIVFFIYVYNPTFLVICIKQLQCQRFACYGTFPPGPRSVAGQSGITGQLLQGRQIVSEILFRILLVIYYLLLSFLHPIPFD